MAATVMPSTVRPSQFRLRVVGSDGGELIVSREDLGEIVAKGAEELARLPEELPALRKCAR